jgi:TRAP-type C4-dicarboxylate transport system permease small subunit
MAEDPRVAKLGSLARSEASLVAFFGWALVAMLSGMIAVVSMQIASRYLLDISLIWSEEVARLLFITMVFLGAALLARRREHLAVTAFVDLLPPRGRHLADALVETIALICGSYLLRGAWATFVREWDQRTPGLQFPMGFIFGVIVLTSALLTVWLALNLAASLRAVANGSPHERDRVARGPEDKPL